MPVRVRRMRSTRHGQTPEQAACYVLRQSVRAEPSIPPTSPARRSRQSSSSHRHPGPDTSPTAAGCAISSPPAPTDRPAPPATRLPPPAPSNTTRPPPPAHPNPPSPSHPALLPPTTFPLTYVHRRHAPPPPPPQPPGGNSHALFSIACGGPNRPAPAWSVHPRTDHTRRVRPAARACVRGYDTTANIPGLHARMHGNACGRTRARGVSDFIFGGFQRVRGCMGGDATVTGAAAATAMYEESARRVVTED